MGSDAQPRADDGAFSIRECTLADYENVADLWQAAGLELRPLDAKEEVAKKLRRDPDLFLLARIGSRIVGSVMGGWDGWRGWVYRVAVDPAYRRHGIGRMLMQELEKRLSAKGARRICLGFYDENVAARDFYHSLGYQDDHRVVFTMKEPAQYKELQNE